MKNKKVLFKFLAIIIASGSGFIINELINRNFNTLAVELDKDGYNLKQSVKYDLFNSNVNKHIEDSALNLEDSTIASEDSINSVFENIDNEKSK